VLALRDGVAVRLPVKVGLRGDGYTEIIEGIAAGEALIPATYVQVQAGQRVRTAGATTTATTPANANANAAAGAAAAEKK
jgi:hypothetical protein